MKTVLRLIVFLALLLCIGQAQAAYFQGLGDLPGSDFYSVANAVSADGSTVVGGSSSANGYEAFRWTTSTGMVGLGDLPGGGFESGAKAVSADGSVVVGTGDSEYMHDDAFRWTASTGMVKLFHWAPAMDDVTSKANGVSADGSTIVGWFCPASSTIAFRWTESGSLESIRYPDPDYQTESDGANGISADGSVVVGVFDTEYRSAGPVSFRWTASAGAVLLGALPGGVRSEAYDVSADGSVVVGFGESASGSEAFRWAASTGMVGLGDLSGGSFDSSANAVSADGSIVVGRGTTEMGRRAFIWDKSNGMRNLRSVLVNLGVNMTDWVLEGAAGISADGQTIVGSGKNPDGNTEAWIANISDSTADNVFSPRFDDTSSWAVYRDKNNKDTNVITFADGGDPGERYKVVVRTTTGDRINYMFTSKGSGYTGCDKSAHGGEWPGYRKIDLRPNSGVARLLKMKMARRSGAGPRHAYVGFLGSGDQGWDQTSGPADACGWLATCDSDDAFLLDETDDVLTLQTGLTVDGQTMVGQIEEPDLHVSYNVFSPRFDDTSTWALYKDTNYKDTRVITFADAGAPGEKYKVVIKTTTGDTINYIFTSKGSGYTGCDRSAYDGEWPGYRKIVLGSNAGYAKLLKMKMIKSSGAGFRSAYVGFFGRGDKGWTQVSGPADGCGW